MSGEHKPLVGSRARPFLAAVLALTVAGLGHAYLRRWGRAAGWFAMILGTSLALVGTFADPTVPIDEMPTTVLYPIAGLTVLSALDAYLLARGTSTVRSTGDDVDDETGQTACPHCGNEVDADLSFCHWCTEPLPGAEGATEQSDHSPRA